LQQVRFPNLNPNFHPEDLSSPRCLSRPSSRRWPSLDRVSASYNEVVFFGVPHLATCIFLFFYKEPELGVEIDPDMALTPLPSSIEWGSNPGPSDRELSALPLDHSFRFFIIKFGKIVAGPAPSKRGPSEGLLDCQNIVNLCKFL
jgi:hypothetical protein